MVFLRRVASAASRRPRDRTRFDRIASVLQRFHVVAPVRSRRAASPSGL